MSNPANRVIGSEVLVEMLLTGVTEASAVWTLAITGSPTSGGYHLYVNGEMTSLIAHDADDAAIEAALVALNGVGASDVSVSSNVITFAGDLANSYVSMAVGPDTLDTGSVTLTETTEGMGWIVLTGDYTSFSFNRQTDVVDVTAGNETDRYEKPTIESADWSLSIFDAIQGYQDKLVKGATGQIRVFPIGKAVGKPYFGFNTVVTGYNEEFAFDSALEIEVTGNRQGAMLNEIGSRWTA
jgi:hypothetical protein